MIKLVFHAMIAACIAGASTAGWTAETVIYTYDAKGRLIKVVRSGTVNNGVTATYEHDKADNRTQVKTTGSLNPPPP